MKIKNPFKLVGSYVGLLAGIVLGYFSFAAIFTLAELGIFKPIALSIPFIVLVTCFFIGYLIHLFVLYIQGKIKSYKK